MGDREEREWLCVCVSGQGLALRCAQAVFPQPLRDFPGGIDGRGSGNLGISQASTWSGQRELEREGRGRAGEMRRGNRPGLSAAQGLLVCLLSCTASSLGAGPRPPGLHTHRFRTLLSA